MNRRLRVLMLANCFPKPANPSFAIWALVQAQALARNEKIELLVVSPTSWIPGFCRIIKRAKRWVDCPAEHHWGQVKVRYVRWPLYQFEAMKQLDYGRPWWQHAFAWFWAKRRLREIVREWRPDIIYAHHTWNSGDIARRLKADFGLPFIVTDHDYTEIAGCERFPERRRYFGKVLAAADMAAPVAQRMASAIADLFPGTKVMVAHNGADPIPQAIEQTPRPPELEGKTIIFCCAGFYPCKNIPLLVRAFAKVAHQSPDAVLRIGGDGADRPQILQAIEETGLHDRVTMLGSIPHSQVLQEMIWCDLFALVGEKEAFGVVYAEAFAAGKPVICCSDCGFMDVFVPGTHGLAVPPNDEPAAAAALNELLADAPKRRRMGEAAKAFFDSYLSNDQRAAALIQTFEQIVAQSPTVPSASV